MVENVGVVFRSRRYLIYMKMLWKGCGKSLLWREKKEGWFNSTRVSSEYA